jgi:hypothetical protein
MVKFRSADSRTVMASEWASFRWPVYRMTVVEGVWNAAAGACEPPSDHPLRRFMPASIPAEGIFFPNEATVDPVAQAVLLRVPVEGRHGYNPIPVADDLFRAAITVDVNSVEALTKFVNTWGRLGVGLNWPTWQPGQEFEHAPVALGEVVLDLYRREIDSVCATRDALRQLQQFVCWLSAIQYSRWDADCVPELKSVRVWAQTQLSVCGLQDKLPEVPSRRDYPKLHTLAFAGWVTRYLEGVHPTIHWDADAGIIPAWVVRSPIELLWTTLWDWATRGGRLRRCPRCRAYFPAEHASKRFCSHECAGRASAARWYRTKGKKLRQLQRKRGPSR